MISNLEVLQKKIPVAEINWFPAECAALTLP